MASTSIGPARSSTQPDLRTRRSFLVRIAAFLAAPFAAKSAATLPDCADYYGIPYWTVPDWTNYTADYAIVKKKKPDVIQAIRRAAEAMDFETTAKKHRGNGWILIRLPNKGRLPG